MAQYIGKPIELLLQANPFNKWNVQRELSLDTERPEVYYSFENCGLFVITERQSEKITCVMLRDNQCERLALTDLTFNQSRDEILARFGNPQKSGEPSSHSMLGEYGPWERFQMPGYIVHFEFSLDSKQIEKITFMANEIAP